MRAAQFRHRSQIVLDLPQGHRPGVPRQLVRPRKDHHHLRLQRDYVRTKANQHLRRCLPANAAIDIRLAGKKSAELRAYPHVRDRIAHEDHALLGFRRRHNFRISLAVARQVRPIVQYLVCPFELRRHRRQLGAIPRRARLRSARRLGTGNPCGKSQRKNQATHSLQNFLHRNLALRAYKKRRPAKSARPNESPAPPYSAFPNTKPVLAFYGHHPSPSPPCSIQFDYEFLTWSPEGDSVRITTLARIAFLAVLALFLLSIAHAQSAGQAQTQAAAPTSPAGPVWEIKCPGVPNVTMTADAEQSLPLQVVATLKCGEEVIPLSNSEAYAVN